MKKFPCIFVVAVVLLLSSAIAQAQMPVAVSPGVATQDAVVGQTCPTFSWSSVEGASTYTVAVFEQQTDQILSYEEMMAIAAPLISFNIDAPALSWTPSVGSCLKSGSEYVWYVSGTDSQGRSTWSEGKAFQVEASALTIEQKDAVQEAVKEYLTKEAAKPLISSGRVTANVAPGVSRTSLSGSSGPMGSAGIGPAVSLVVSSGVEINNTLTIPYASDTTQLVIGDANYSTWKSGPNLSIGSNTSSSFLYIGQSNTRKGGLGWIYESNPAWAYLNIGTLNAENPLVLQELGGLVGIGKIPTESLDVNGNAKANAFLYTDAQKRYWSLPGSAFQPLESGQAYTKLGGALTNGAGDFDAPVNLPHGAVVTKMTVLSFNCCQNSTFSIELRRKLLTLAGTSETMASVTSYALGTWQTGIDTSIYYATIDNGQYVYYLYEHGMDGNIEKILSGVIIEYTVTSPLP